MYCPNCGRQINNGICEACNININNLVNKNNKPKVKILDKIISNGAIIILFYITILIDFIAILHGVNKMILKMDGSVQGWAALFLPFLLIEHLSAIIPSIAGIVLSIINKYKKKWYLDIAVFIFSILSLMAIIFAIFNEEMLINNIYCILAIILASVLIIICLIKLIKTITELKNKKVKF